LDILVTAAGESKRFGGQDKYLLDVLGFPMLHWALRSIGKSKGHNVVIVISKEENKAQVEKIAKEAGFPEVTVEIIEETTGQAHTVQQSLKFLKGRAFLVIPVDTVLAEPLNTRGLSRNTIITFPSKDYSSYSFVKLDGDNVVSIEEKAPGDLATAGYYSFASKEQYQAAWDLIDHGQEEYISHIYQKLIELGKSVKSQEIPANSVIDLGTPAKVEENLDRIFEKLLADVPKQRSISFDDLKKELQDVSYNPDNKFVLDLLESHVDKPISDRVGFGSLVHNYNYSCRTINQLLKEKDLSWVTFFLYDTVDGPYSLWRYLESRLGANLVVIEDSADIKYKVPHKRQAIIDHFTAIGKEWTVIFDDDFSWRIAYKKNGSKTPKSRAVDFPLAVKMIAWLAVEQDYDFLCTGTNTRRMQYVKYGPVISRPGAIYWNFFLMRNSVLKERGIRFVTDRQIHEDLAMSLDIAKSSDSAYVLFLYQVPSFDFNQQSLVDREEETVKYGEGFWDIKIKLQGGMETKFFNINRQKIAEHKKPEKTKLI